MSIPGAARLAPQFAYEPGDGKGWHSVVNEKKRPTDSHRMVCGAQFVPMMTGASVPAGAKCCGVCKSKVERNTRGF